MNTLTLLIGYLVLINGIAFLMMFIDKRRAKRHAFRVPESILFELAILFGSIGILLGMFAFRHKTRKLRFTLGIPVILLIQAMLLVLFLTTVGKVTFL
ncbi:MAG: DUF1294 domain-containing protein [Lachnospiraceae bacterium]|nr:DUF1294 domain-containing protein [Lachnospiraceae bacterium]